MIIHAHNQLLETCNNIQCCPELLDTSAGSIMELCSGFGWFIRGPLLVGAVTTPVLTGLHTSGAGLCERPGEKMAACRSCASFG